MKKIIYLLAFFMLSIPGASYCMEHENDTVHQEYDTYSENDAEIDRFDTFSDFDVILYCRDNPIIGPISFIYLILKPLEKTYELYPQYGLTEIGTWEQNKDTITLTPRLAIATGNGWEYAELPDTVQCDKDMNIQKTFIMKDGGSRLLEITPYSHPSQRFDEYLLVGSNFLGDYLKRLKKEKRKKRK